MSISPPLLVATRWPLAGSAVMPRYGVTLGTSVAATVPLSLNLTKWLPSPPNAAPTPLA